MKYRSLTWYFSIFQLYIPRS